jgi:exopolysaccharide biosynthesis predicted pyruvyltransferase EpsI
MIDIFLSTLNELLEVQKDHKTGQADDDSVLLAKKRFIQALNDYIDFRVNASMERRRKHMSESRIALADDLHAQVSSTASAIKSISALNSAPPPPKEPKEEAIKEWLKEYNEWYDNKRANGMTIG